MKLKFLLPSFLLVMTFLSDTSKNVYAISDCTEAVGGVIVAKRCPTTNDSQCHAFQECGSAYVCRMVPPVGGTYICVSALGEAKITNNKIGGYVVANAPAGGVGSSIGTGLRDLINNVTFAVGVIVGLIFFAMLVMGGIGYMMSAGDEKALTKAKQQITAGLIGLVIVFMAWWVVKIISVIFGINILQPKFTGP